MEKKLYILFIVTTLLDIAVVPFITTLPWLPYFSLALLPAVALFANNTHRRWIFTLTVIIVWVTTGSNAGVVIFSMGVFLFFEEWFVGRFFHTYAWQTIVISAGGIVFALGILGGLSALLTPEYALYSTVFVIKTVTTVTAAILISYGIKRFIV